MKKERSFERYMITVTFSEHILSNLQPAVYLRDKPIFSKDWTEKRDGIPLA